MTIGVTHQLQKNFEILFGMPSSPPFMTLLLCGIVVFFCSPAFSAQTRDQCEACCKSAGYDEYYTEQCRLKCFRYPDHCAQSHPRREPSPAAAREKAPESTRHEPTAPPRASKFVWPKPLNLTPGKEGEAAAQILAANGIPHQHPNFQPALQSIQNVLVNFARNNPSGGKLPAAQLERILKRFR